jgi:hypothetical protein
MRLAERILPRLDVGRLQGVESIEDIMHFLRVGDATHAELEQQLKTCFRFGLATTVDPQLWWDSFCYAVSLGHAHGLVDFMPPGAAIALPLTDARTLISSRDLRRLAVSVPCLLGLCRKPATASIKYALAIPPSASTTFGGRIRWELAVVQSFGVTYPKADIERIPAGAFAADLLYAVSEARDQRDLGALEALVELLEIYKTRMGALLPMLQAAFEASRCPEEFLLEERTQFQPYSSSCSPKYIDELLEFANVTLTSPSFHDTRDLLEESLGVLR